MRALPHALVILGLTALYFQASTDTYAQAPRPQPKPNAASNAQSCQPVVIEKTEFRCRTATIANGDMTYIAVRVTLAAINRGDKPIGIFIDPRHSSVATDTGIEIVGDSVRMHTSGVGVCFDYPNLCNEQADKYVVSLPPQVTDNMILTFYRLPGLTDQAMKQAVRQATAIDISVSLYIRAANGQVGTFPLTFDDVELQANSYR